MFSSLFFHSLSVCNVVRLCGKLKLLLRFNALRQRNPIQLQIIHKSNIAFEATTKPRNHTTTQQHNHCNKISVLSSHDKNTTNVCSTHASKSESGVGGRGREPFNIIYYIYIITLYICNLHFLVIWDYPLTGMHPQAGPCFSCFSQVSVNLQHGLLGSEAIRRLEQLFSGPPAGALRTFRMGVTSG